MWIPADGCYNRRHLVCDGHVRHGSHDFGVDNILVPKHLPWPNPADSYSQNVCFLVTSARSTVGNTVRTSQWALETFVALAARARALCSPTLLRDRAPGAQTRVAEAEAILSAARATR